MALDQATSIITPESLIGVITNQSSQRADRLVALLTFTVWMRWPDDQDAIRHAQIVAQANIFLDEQTHGRQMDPAPSVEVLAQALINSPLIGSYSEVLERTPLLAADIVSFFMHCPIELSPSLNKARYFIEEGGFVCADATLTERKQLTPSQTLVKAAWAEQAVAAPFVWAAGIFADDEMADILSIAPDSNDAVLVAEEFLASKSQITAFFGAARFSQERLLQRLDTHSRERFEWVVFPDTICAIDPGVGFHDEDQQAITMKYRAPQ